MTIDIRDTPTDAKALLVRGLASVDIVDGVPHEYIAASTKAFVARLSPPTPDPDVGPLHVEPSTPTARRMTSVAPPLDVDY
jgi:hypothetical protein